MTATLNPTTTDAPAETEATETPTTEPVCQTFTVGTVTIEAADETEALRKYQRMVRAEALKAKVDMNWCDSGTNERLRILGLREVGQGTAMRVTVTATRTAYLTIDADTPEEARQVVDEGGPDVLALATASIGRGWNVTALAANDTQPVDMNKTREIGDPDDTVSGLARNNPSEGDSIPRCDRYHNTGYYCTMPAGHTGRHAAGNGIRIVDVWNQRTTS